MKARTPAVVLAILLLCLVAEAAASERGQVRVGIRVVHGCDIHTDGSRGGSAIPVRVTCSSPTPYQVTAAKVAPAPRITAAVANPGAPRVTTLTF